MKESSLLTDLYQITMAYGYWKTGKSDQEALFNLFYRTAPFGGKYVITTGLKFVLDYISTFSYSIEDILYLKSLNLFDNKFLDYLYRLGLSIDIDAVPEGTIIFPQEPILSVKGPILQCQLLESTLLNIINFNSLIATKASRICCAAMGLPVLEFGLRRAQGPDGALSGSRAAYIGGCTGTSNVLAGKMFGIPVRGTMAHSWIMSFDTELEAFKAYAKVMPTNCIFLVDTYDVVQGVKNAITVGNEILRPNGHKFGIRLDSGNLVADSLVARTLLTDAGFSNTTIVVSNDLDEYKISEMLDKENSINAFGVGTSLITAKDDPALGGVYKLSAVRSPDGRWRNKIKHSRGKTTLPGELQTTRKYDGYKAIGDTIHFTDFNYFGSRLLQNVIKNGLPSKPSYCLDTITLRVEGEIKSLDCALDIHNPPDYPVSIDERVVQEQLKLIKTCLL